MDGIIILLFYLKAPKGRLFKGRYNKGYYFEKHQKRGRLFQGQLLFMEICTLHEAVCMEASWLSKQAGFCLVVHMEKKSAWFPGRNYLCDHSGGN